MTDSIQLVRRIMFILVVIGLLWIGIIMVTRILFGTNQSTTTKTSLASYAQTDSTASYYIDGPVVGNQEHWAINITVTATQAQIQRINGYDGQVVRQDTFPNTTDSYTVFLKSLDTLGFSSGNNDSKRRDERGQCPLGNRYIYRMSNFNQEVFRYWSTSCGGGTFGGRRSDVRSLFRLQIPPAVYNEYTSGTSIS